MDATTRAAIVKQFTEPPDSAIWPRDRESAYRWQREIRFSLDNGGDDWMRIARNLLSAKAVSAAVADLARRAEKGEGK